jgi:hypothetical protein
MFLIFLLHYFRSQFSCELGSNKFYAFCGFGGFMACGITHFVMTPLDIVKCRLQVRLEPYKTLVEQRFPTFFTERLSFRLLKKKKKCSLQTGGDGGVRRGGGGEAVCTQHGGWLVGECRSRGCV